MNTEDDADLRDLVLTKRLLCDFGFFTRYFFRHHNGRKFTVAGHHQRMFEALARVAAGQCKRLVLNVPPRAGKTEIAVKMFLAWCLANNNRAKFIHLSYSNDLALDNSSAVRELVKSDEYQRLFPVRLKTDSDSKKKWYTAAGGGVYATAAGGAITGFGAGTMGRTPEGTGSVADGFGGGIVIDDALKPDDAFSETMRGRINRRYNNTIASRVNSPDTPIVVIMQRLHEDDMAGFLLAGGSGEEWEHLCIPVMDEAGQSIWPEKWTRERLAEMERADPYTFAGQYMQRPAPLAGGIIRPDNITVIDALPIQPMEWVRGWDFASTLAGDYTAGAKLARMPDGRLLIADMVRLRAAPDERDQALLHAAQRDGMECRQSIPQDPGQAGVTQVKYLLRQLAGHRVHASAETGSKIVRAEPLAAQINVGNVLMLKAPWNDALVAEMRMFPNGSHDDQVDALSRAFSLLVGKGASEIFIPDVGSPLEPADLGTCGRCAFFDGGACNERLGLRVQATSTACPMFVSRFSR